MDDLELKERLERLERALETLLADRMPPASSPGYTRRAGLYFIETSSVAHSWTNSDGSVCGHMIARPVA